LMGGVGRYGVKIKKGDTVKSKLAARSDG